MEPHPVYFLQIPAKTPSTFDHADVEQIRNHSSFNTLFPVIQFGFEFYPILISLGEDR